MLHTIHLVLKQQHKHESTRNEHPSEHSLISPPVTSWLLVCQFGCLGDKQGSDWPAPSDSQLPSLVKFPSGP